MSVVDAETFCRYTSVMAGRRKKPAGETKTYTLRIRRTATERALVEEAARSRSLETSSWARSELMTQAKKILGKK